MTLPRLSIEFQDPAEPLRMRAPSHGEDGRPLCDFMMLVPGLRQQPRHMIDSTIREIHAVLLHFRDDVVFAEFNLRLNLLWVSIKPVNGLRLRIAGSIQERVPEAKLIAHI